MFGVQLLGTSNKHSHEEAVKGHACFPQSGPGVME